MLSNSLILTIVLVALVKDGHSVDSSKCTSYPCKIFEDNFDWFDFETWEHEITAGGGGVSEKNHLVQNKNLHFSSQFLLLEQ